MPNGPVRWSQAYCLTKLQRFAEADEVLRRGIGRAMRGRNSLRARLLWLYASTSAPLRPNWRELAGFVRDAVDEIGAADSSPLGIREDLECCAVTVHEAQDHDLAARRVTRCRQTVPEGDWPEQLRQLAAEVDENSRTRSR